MNWVIMYTAMLHIAEQPQNISLFHLGTTKSIYVKMF